MIKQFSEFKFGKLTIQANYNKDVIPCKKIKLIVDDKFEEINKHDLYALLMLYADDAEMDEAVKISEKKVKMIRKAVKVTANKDLKKGEDVTFIIEIPVDADIYDKLELDHGTIDQDTALEKLK
jgi:hypothetical protein